MSLVEFSYKGRNITIQCNPYDKLKNIIERFLFKSGLNFKSVSFLYSGFQMSNFGLTFNELANIDDRNRGKMNILVIDIDNNYYNNNENSMNYNLIRNKNELTYQKPFIFETMANLNKRFEQIEKDVKMNSINLKRKVELMQNKLMTINKKKIRFSSDTYYGETIGNEITGFGIIESDNGDRYEGQMLDCDRSGIGIFYGASGDIFMGEYKHNKRNGFGIEENPRVGKYEGSWLDDCLTGTGILSYKGGQIYIGQIDKAQLSGFGKYLYNDGSYYIGEFKDSCRTKGKVFYPDEQGIFDAIWDENDERAIAKGIFYFPDGRKEKRTRVIKGKDSHWEYN